MESTHSDLTTRPEVRDDGGVRERPAEQEPTVRVYPHALREELTPVYGTAAPPHGLSGLIRRYAYSVPEHKPRHFRLLFLADRMDALEHGVLPKVPFGAALAVTGGIVARKVVRHLRSRAKPSRWARAARGRRS